MEAFMVPATFSFTPKVIAIMVNGQRIVKKVKKCIDFENGEKKSRFFRDRNI